MGTDADRIAWRAAGSLDDLLGDRGLPRGPALLSAGVEHADEESDSLLPALRGASARA